MTVARISRRAAVAVGVVVGAVVVVGIAVALAGAGGGGSPADYSVGSAPARAVGGDVATGELAPAPGTPISSVQPRSLVRTAEITVEVADAAVSARDIRAAAVASGGFVGEERSGSYGSWVTVRVPTDALDRLVEDVAALGTVLERSASVVDATEEVVDLDARVTSQQASVTRVRVLLAQASSIGDVVAIESELARREAELDSLSGRLAAVRDQVALSTLTVDLRGPAGGPVTGEPRMAGFLDGLAAGWSGLLAVGAGAGAVAGFLLPFLPVVAVLAGVVWLVVRMVRGRRRPAPAAGDPT